MRSLLLEKLDSMGGEGKRRGIGGGELRDPAESVGGKPRNKPQPKTLTAAELAGKKFEPLRWIIPAILPEGVSLLVGSPKIGKSWLALDLCVSKALGGDVLGEIKNIVPGESLYLALEDNQRRLQRRLNSRLRGRRAPEGMHITCEWPGMASGGVQHLRDWIAANPNCRLVIIDTLARFRPPSNAKKGIYEQDHDIGTALIGIAAEFQIAIVLIHHDRKAESEDILQCISGSQGLAGGVDNVLILRRSRFTADAELHVTGRDIEDEQVYSLEFRKDSCSWAIVGAGKESLLAPEKRRIIEMLKDKGPMSGRDVAGVLHPGKAIERNCKELQRVNRTLSSLVESGLIEKQGNAYSSKSTEYSEYAEYSEYTEYSEYGGSEEGDSCVHGVERIQCIQCIHTPQGSPKEPYTEEF